MDSKIYQQAINVYKALSRRHVFDPRQVKIEATKVCNLTCAGCRRNFADSIANVPGPKHLTVDVLKTIIEGTKIKVVRFAGDGEPLCNPHLEHILEYLHSVKVKWAITTNGTLVDERWVRLAKRSGAIRVSISFDGVEKATFEKLRGGANYEQVLEVCKIISRNGVPLFMNCLLSTDEVIEQLPGYIQLAKSVGATGVHLMKYQSQDNTLWTPPNWSKHAGMLERITKEARKAGLVLSAPSYNTCPTFRECEDPYIAPWVALTGEVFPCVYMANMREYEIYEEQKISVPWRNYVMGNINETPIRGIWRKEAYAELRTVLKQTSRKAGYQTGPSTLLLMKRAFKGNERFGYCFACPCRWGESGI